MPVAWRVNIAGLPGETLLKLLGWSVTLGSSSEDGSIAHMSGGKLFKSFIAYQVVHEAVL